MGILWPNLLYSRAVSVDITYASCTSPCISGQRVLAIFRCQLIFRNIIIEVFRKKINKKMKIFGLPPLQPFGPAHMALVCYEVQNRRIWGMGSIYMAHLSVLYIPGFKPTSLQLAVGLLNVFHGNLKVIVRPPLVHRFNLFLRISSAPYRMPPLSKNIGRIACQP